MLWILGRHLMIYLLTSKELGQLSLQECFTRQLQLEFKVDTYVRLVHILPFFPRWSEWKSGNNSAARFVMHPSKQLVIYKKQMFEQKNIIENQSTSSCGKSQEIQLLTFFTTGRFCLFFFQVYRKKGLWTRTYC